MDGERALIEFTEAIIMEQAGVCDQVLKHIADDQRTVILPAMEQPVAAL